MEVSSLPAPSRSARPFLTSLEPWQQEAVIRLREQLGIDGDALIRAGLTLVLGLIAQGMGEGRCDVCPLAKGVDDAERTAGCGQSTSAE